MRLLALSLVLTLTLAISAQEKEGKKKGPGPFVGPFTNLKVLKPEQVQQTMAAARTGLGQACTLCHVQGEWADDSKPEKTTARMMISMTGDINAKFGDGKVHVTCFTCHRGEEMPLTAAPAPPAQ